MLLQLLSYWELSICDHFMNYVRTRKILLSDKTEPSANIHCWIMVYAVTWDPTAFEYGFIQRKGGKKGNSISIVLSVITLSK